MHEDGTAYRAAGAVSPPGVRRIGRLQPGGFTALTSLGKGKGRNAVLKKGSTQSWVWFPPQALLEVIEDVTVFGVVEILLTALLHSSVSQNTLQHEGIWDLCMNIY